MQKLLLSVLLVTALVSACGQRQDASAVSNRANESDAVISDLKAQVARLQQENAELRATPAAMLTIVQAAGADLVKAGEALATLEKKYPESAEAKHAASLVASLRADEEKRADEAK